MRGKGDKAMGGTVRVGFFRLFRLWELFLIGGGASGLLAVFGLLTAAIGLLIGFGLFALKSFFLYEASRSLLQNAGRKRSGVIAAFASFGRFIFLGVALALVAQFDQMALFAACGGLIFSQAYLHLSYLIRMRAAGRPQCSNT